MSDTLGIYDDVVCLTLLTIIDDIVDNTLLVVIIFLRKKYVKRVPQSLALRGFGVLIPDPYGQGERQEGEMGCTTAHNAFGYRLGLLGEFFGTWRVHDALTALEYLKSRPEINSKKLCVTGCSGGGTMTSYVAGFASDPLRD